MSTYWQLYPLTELLEHIVDNRGRTAPTSENGIPLIATNCISNEDLYPRYEKVRYVSEETYRTWFRSHPKPGDIIFVNKGTPGLVCLVPDPVDFCIAQDMVALRPNDNLVYGEYLFAVLRSPFMQEQIANLHVGTLIPHVKKGDFDKILIPIPPMELQIPTGRIYTDFCRKIELNRRLNATLEATARALFKSWFVDFDPVHAKAAGRPPEGMDATTAALFPDHFEDSELGPIPAGWRVGTLGDVAHLQNGKAIQANSEGRYPVYGSNGIIGKCDVARYSDGIIIGRVGAFCGSLAYCRTDFWASDNTIVVLSIEGSYSSIALYFLLERLNLPGFAIGSAQPLLTQQGIKNIKVVQAPLEVHSEFRQLVVPIFDKIELTENESRTLAETRDALLPRLVSGELRVGGVDMNADTELS